MTHPALIDSALLLVGHGATDHPQSVATVRAHAGALRARALFHQVLECFYKAPPYLHDAWNHVESPTVFVVPVCISEGYFTTQVIPAALGLRSAPGDSFARHQHVRGREVFYCAPIGTHPSMSDVLLEQAATLLRQFPATPAPTPAATTLLIAGHGTERSPQSRTAIEDHVHRIRQRQLYAAVHPVFMLEAPFIRDWETLSRTPDTLVVPLFISDGLHTAEDIPVLLGEPSSLVRERLARGQPGWINPTVRHGRRLWYSPALGKHPRVTNLILQRVQQAALSG